MSIRFEFFPFGGESILVTTPDFVMLIDGGSSKGYPKLKKCLEELGREIDLAVLTHTDQDHIAGMIRLFKDISKNKTFIKVKEIWFNIPHGFYVESANKKSKSALVSVKQGKTLAHLLSETEIKIFQDISTSVTKFSNSIQLSHDLKLILLSPSDTKLSKFLKTWSPNQYKEESAQVAKKSKNHSIDLSLYLQDYHQVNKDLDSSVANGASISFILSYKNRNFLFLADAHIDDVLQELKSIDISTFELVKLSHHGSSYNMNFDFLSTVHCTNLFACSLGKKLPDKKTLALLEKHGEKYETKYNLSVNNKLGFLLTESESALLKHVSIKEEVKYYGD